MHRLNDNHSKDAYNDKRDTFTAAVKPEMTVETRQIVLKEDCAQGNRLEVESRSGVRSPNKIFPVEKRNDDLVTQVASKYVLGKAALSARWMRC